VQADLTVADHPNVYVVGDIANIPDANGNAFPQLGSVALQAGVWAAKNIAADIHGEPRTPFAYHDKGIMAMIGRNAAIAEMGEHRHELHGPVAFAAIFRVLGEVRLSRYHYRQKRQQQKQ